MNASQRSDYRTDTSENIQLTGKARVGSRLAERAHGDVGSTCRAKQHTQARPRCISSPALRTHQNRSNSFQHRRLYTRWGRERLPAHAALIHPHAMSTAL